MPNLWTGDYDEDEWEAMLAQLIIGGATAYHPTAAVSVDGYYADSVITYGDATETYADY